MRRASRLCSIGLFLFFAAGCAEEAPPSATTEPSASAAFHEIEPPSAPGSRVPGLFLLGERPALSWVEEDDGTATLRFATWDGAAWSAPRTAAEGSQWVVNWADRPGLVALSGDALAAYYLVEHGGDVPHAYDIRLVRSPDGGATWSEPVTPHRDGTPTEHGFVSALAQPDGSLLVAWLDGRGYHPVQNAHDDEEHAPRNATSLRTATLTPDGGLTDEAQLDARTCDCCPTAAVPVPGGALLAYRDRTDDEVRDIAVVLRSGGVWSAPAPVHTDGWQIDGCPVNGPALAADGARVAVAWFTGAEEESRVRVAFSEDGGETFEATFDVDDGRPLGRVVVAWLSEGQVLVGWIEQVGEGAELRVRLVDADGTASSSQRVAAVEAGRATGMPVLLRTGETVLVAWTEPEHGLRVASARVADFTQPAPPAGSVP